MGYIFRALKEVLGRPSYAILTIAIAGLMVIFSIWLDNRELLLYVLSSGLFNTGGKIKIIFVSLGTFKTGFTLSSQIVMISLSLVAAINFSLTVFYFKKRAEILKTAGMSGAALVIGLVGVGCGACGSIILSSIFGLSAATGFLGWLPLNGLEFGWMGIVLMITSIYFLAKKIARRGAC